MTKKVFALSILVTTLFGTAVFAQQYDRAVMLEVMQGNAQRVGRLSQAVQQQNFAQAQAVFQEFHDQMSRILPFTPRRGTKAEWDETIGRFLDAAERGVEAARARNASRVNAAFNELRNLMQEGHSQFR
jgi:cytochrome c556